MKKLFTVLTSGCFSLLLTFSVFAADGEIRYSNEPTVTPIRIFFAVSVVVLLVLFEIVIEKIRNKRVEKRNKEDK